MEKQQDMTPLKVRSYRSVLAVGFRHYMEQFRAFFKASWITALVLAIVYGTLGALTLLIFPATDAPLVVLGVMPLVLPAIYELIRHTVKLNRNYWYSPVGNLKARLRHFGFLFTAEFTSILLMLLVSCVILIPAIILCLANKSALMGMLMGDPSGMPSYMTGMTLFTFILTAFLQFYVSQVSLVHKYFANGSAEAKEAERQKLNITV